MINEQALEETEDSLVRWRLAGGSCGRGAAKLSLSLSDKR